MKAPSTSIMRTRSFLVIGAVVLLAAVVVWLVSFDRDVVHIGAYQRYSIADNPTTLYFRWKDDTRSVLLANQENIGFGVAEIERDKNPAAWERAQNAPPMFPVIAFHLGEHRLEVVTGDDWLRSKHPRRGEVGAPASSYPQFKELRAGHDTGFAVINEDWRRILRTPLLSDSAVTEYQGRWLVAAQTAASPSKSTISNHRDRSGPFYVQVFDESRLQIGPTFKLTGAHPTTNALSLSWIEEECIIIAMEAGDSGRWWIIDMFPYLNEESSG